MGKPVFVIGAIAALALAGCGEEKPKRGLEVLPDMFHTPAYESQNVIVRKDGDEVRHAPVMAAPVAGTVPRGHQPYPLGLNDIAQAKALLNPLAADAGTLRAGQLAYRQVCASCHGLDGNASHAALAPHFAGIPSLNTTAAAQMTDGELYHYQTVGKGRMPAFNAQLTPELRWAVAHYVHALSRATVAATEASAVVTAAEGDLRTRPEDMGLREKLRGARTILEQRQADLDAITRTPDGRAFAPAPKPVPEYIPAAWPNPAPAGGAAHGGH